MAQVVARLIQVVGISWILPAACSPPEGVPTTLPDTGIEAGPSPVIATIESKGGYGKGPVYRIAVHANGEVEYDGIISVKTLGHAVGRISRAEVAAIHALFEGADYMTVIHMPWHGRHVLTSYMPESLPVMRDGRPGPYVGDAVAGIRDELFRIVGGERWVGTPEELEAALYNGVDFSAFEQKEEAERARRASDRWLAIGIEPVSVAGGAYRPGPAGGTSDWVDVVGFEMSRTEVTATQYGRCVQVGACTPAGQGERCNATAAGSATESVRCVDWNQARQFAAWSGGRLPSEAEWEWAARSQEKGSEYPWREKAPSCSPTPNGDDRVLCAADSDRGATRALTDVTAEGIRDLAGGMSEWVADAWSSRHHTGTPPDDAAPADADGATRVVRGGNFQMRPAGAFRVAIRAGREPGDREAGIGFRIVRDTATRPAEGVSGPDRWKSLGLVPIRIPGGSYRPGDPPSSPVNVRTFELSKAEVTIGQYRRCMNAGICTKPMQFGNLDSTRPDDHPVVVSWRQAREFAEWSGGRLPSGEEWEWAARGRKQRRTYPWGEEAPDCSRAAIYVDQHCSPQQTLPVCQTPAGNSLDGVCDLAGNVDEWVAGFYWTEDDPDTSPAGLSGLPYRPVRGGSWASDARGTRVVLSRTIDWEGSATVGFRVARSVRR